MIRLVVAALLVSAVVAALSATGAAPDARSAPVGVATRAPASPLLGMVGQVPPLHLARVDPRTLRTVAGARVETGLGGCASRDGGEACWTVPPWSFSPDRKLLAVARNDRFEVRSLRLVDVRRMRVAADLRLDGDPVGALAWFSGGHILAVQEVCCSSQRLLAVDVATKRVTARHRLPAPVLDVARIHQELVLLLAPAHSIGLATLALADRRGALRTVRLDQIAAGTRTDTSGGHGITRRLPGLAVDPAGRHAFVVGEQLVADVDLATLAVSYHSLAQRSSILGRLSSWVQPTAQAKGVTGTSRTARWLGNGVLAISGDAEQTVVDAQGNEQSHVQPVGLRFVDTRTWNARVVDRDATWFDVAGDLLLATGWSTDSTALGVAAYSLDGVQRFHLFAGERAWVEQTYGGRSYIGITRNDGIQQPLRIVDLAAGALVGERRQPLPWLLLGDAAGWWGPSS